MTPRSACANARFRWGNRFQLTRGARRGSRSPRLHPRRGTGVHFDERAPSLTAGTPDTTHSQDPVLTFCSVFRGPEETRGAVANFLGIRHQKQKQKQANKKNELFRNCYPSSSCRGSVDAYLPPVASACPQVTFGKARETQLTSQRGQNLRNGVFL